MDYILMRHKYRTTSTRQQWVIKENLPVNDTVLKNFMMLLICIRSLIEQIPSEQEEIFSLYGRLALDLFTRKKLLLPNTKVRFKLFLARPNFACYLIIQIWVWKVFIVRWTCSIQLHGNYSKNLYYSISSNQFKQKNIFNNAPKRRIAAAMNTNSTVAGPCLENHISYEQFHLRELRIIRGGRTIVSLDTTSPCRLYVTTL